MGRRMKTKPAHSASLQITPSGVQELEKSLDSGSCYPVGLWVTLSWTVLTIAGTLPAASCPPGHGGGLHIGTGVDRGPQGKIGSVTAPSDTPGPMSLMQRTWVGPGTKEGGRQCMVYIILWLQGGKPRVSRRVAKKRPR